MTTQSPSVLASAIVLGTGVIWGFYWLPVRAVSDLGLAGAWGTVAITLAAVLMLLPVVALRKRRLLAANKIALLSITIGGAAFALYSVGLVYGRVAIIILLYFLTPVWSTLIGRFVMGWHTPPLRVVSIIVGLLGLGVMLGADGQVPIPRGLGEWLALVAGILWAIGTTGIRATSDLHPIEAAFVFGIGALVSAGLVAVLMEPFPDLTPRILGATAALSLGAGFFWWVLSIAILLWATMQLEPARVGILLMSEVLIGAVSAALLAGEHLSALEVAGGGMVVLAALLEVWPVRSR
jgi:drug/metabolite transporter (DMT)-like permease